jgi:hypothetical protein
MESLPPADERWVDAEERRQWWELRVNAGPGCEREGEFEDE